MNQLTTPARPAPTPTFNLFDPASFAHIQRVAGMYAASEFLPAHLKKGSREAALANAVMVLNLADRLREDFMTVAANVYFVGGKPGWSASYMIARANQAEVFRDPIEFTTIGKGDDLAVTATAKMKRTGTKVEATVSMETAKLEGWTKNPKYRSMPENMLTYRAATALIRRYAPEVMLGMAVLEEQQDEQIKDVSPAYPEPEPQPEPEIEDAETVEEAEPAKNEKPAEPKPVNRQRPTPAPKKDPEPEPETETAAEPEESVEQESEPEPAKATKKTERKDWSTFMAAVKRDLDQSEGDIGGVIGFYGEQLRDMRKSDPEAFDELESQLGIDVASEL